MVHKINVVPHNQGVFCLFCQITIAVMKEYIIKRHYTTKRFSQFDKIVGQAGMDKTEHLKKSFKKQQGIFNHLQERFRTGDKTEF